MVCCFFFFQAEDGIRDIGVTGVQTCALPIYPEIPIVNVFCWWGSASTKAKAWGVAGKRMSGLEIGRASCRERV